MVILPGKYKLRQLRQLAGTVSAGGTMGVPFDGSASALGMHCMHAGHPTTLGAPPSGIERCRGF